MTPKEKAQELFDKFNNPDTTHYPYVHNAQQCASIAVDEIISTLKSSNTDDPMVIPYSEIVYWREVKQEIEKL